MIVVILFFIGIFVTIKLLAILHLFRAHSPLPERLSGTRFAKKKKINMSVNLFHNLNYNSIWSVACNMQFLVRSGNVYCYKWLMAKNTLFIVWLTFLSFIITLVIRKKFTLFTKQSQTYAFYGSTFVLIFTPSFLLFFQEVRFTEKKQLESCALIIHNYTLPAPDSCTKIFWSCVTIPLSLRSQVSPHTLCAYLWFCEWAAVVNMPIWHCLTWCCKGRLQFIRDAQHCCCGFIAAHQTAVGTAAWKYEVWWKKSEAERNEVANPAKNSINMNYIHTLLQVYYHFLIDQLEMRGSTF